MSTREDFSEPRAASSRRKGPAPRAPGQTKAATLPVAPMVNTERVKRPCPEHNFLTDVADVRQMEKGLLLLLDDFHAGKLQVFGQGCTFDQMDQVREQQERLSRLHFDLDAQQQIQSLEDGDEREDLTFRNLNKLVDNLDELSKSVNKLKSGTTPLTAHSPEHNPTSAGKHSSDAKKFQF